MRNKLRAAVIGLGVGEQHVRSLANHPECEVVLACDISPCVLTSFSTRWPDIRTSQNAADAFDDPNVDIISIASYDNLHFDQVVAALDNEKHVFVEKPICQTREQLRKIKQSWARHDGQVKLQCNFVLRTAPVYRWLKGELASDTFGQLFSFDGDYLFGRLSKITDGWRGNLAYYSVMAGGGSHMIDLLLWMTGQQPDTATVAGNRICTNGTKFRFDDFVAATLTFPSGLIARITANFGCVHGHQHVVRAFGTKGTFLYDDQGPRVQFDRDPAPPAKRLALATLAPSKGALIPEFVDAIVNDRDIRPETQAVFNAISVCMACDEALKKGKTVRVKYE